MKHKIKSSALFSRCKPSPQHRYILERTWDKSKDVYLVICLNPSHSNSIRTDQTVDFLIGVVDELGGGSLLVANLFSKIAGNFGVLKSCSNPNNPINDRAIKKLEQKANTIIVAWGKDGKYQGRDNVVVGFLNQPLYCFGKNKDGSPTHPKLLQLKQLPISLQIW
ncbi:MAG: DUF1643 domain-containing protein [Methylococcales bacterium]|nr:DUF1643 domain-containing protein [Methylococcales bacterium]MDP3838808.1 DUF1643 domain-containing protein [Methylococcales bacterium]